MNTTTNVLILYGTTAGQTAKIARRIGYELGERGILADELDVRNVPQGFTLACYQGVIVGASVHLGGFQHRVHEFARRHHDELVHLPSAFFSVSLTAAYPQADELAKLERYVSGFFDETDWHPRMVASFAGELAYTRYDFVTRRLVRHIAQEVGAPTDLTRDAELTNWDDVVRFADRFTVELAIAPIPTAEPAFAR